MFEHVKSLRAMGEIVGQQDVDWLIQRIEHLTPLAHQRDEALAEVERLRSVLAEPSKEEVTRLWGVFVDSDSQRDGILAILADLRKRAGGVSVTPSFDGVSPFEAAGVVPTEGSTPPVAAAAEAWLAARRGDVSGE